MKPKVLRDNPDKLIVHIRRWMLSGDTYTVRYGINLLMSFYLEDNFDTEYLELVAGISSEEYYVNMMRAWYFATALAKQYKFAVSYITEGKLDVWTHNKTIQKAIESNRIDKSVKEFLKQFRIR